jgi:hypothetical protein
VIVVSLRLYTRLRVTCSAGIDDVLIVIGLIFAIAHYLEAEVQLLDSDESKQFNIPDMAVHAPMFRSDCGVLIVNIVCFSLALIVVSLRLYTRLRVTCSAGMGGSI